MTTITSRNPSASLVFQNTTFDIIDRNGAPWLKGNELASALGYADASSINRIFSRRSDEFTDAMTGTVKLTDPNGDLQETRIFSMRGCYAIAMFAKTEIAKEFRRWVLDVLDRETVQALPEFITPAQQNTLQQIVALKSGESGGLRAYCWSRFNNHFHLGSYKQLPAVYFDEAVAYLESMPMKKEPALPPPVTSPLIGQRILTRLEEGGRYSTEIVPVDAYVLTLASFEELLARSGKSIVPTETVNAIKKLQLLAA